MLAHIHIMKTGGQTIRGILRRNYGPKHCDLIGQGNDADMRWARRCYHDCLTISGHEVRPSSFFKHYFPDARFFSMLREPASRLISHYQFYENKRWQLPDFERFIDHYPNNVCYILTGGYELEPAIKVINQHVGFVGLMEQYNQSLVLWKKWSGLPELDIRYQAQNVSRNNETKKQILAIPGIDQLIREKNEADFQLYEYVKNELFPQQINQYGTRFHDDLVAFEKTLENYQLPKFSMNQFLGRMKRKIVYRPFIKMPHFKKRLAA